MSETCQGCKFFHPERRKIAHEINPNRFICLHTSAHPIYGIDGKRPLRCEYYSEPMVVGTHWPMTIAIDWELAVRSWTNLYGFTRNSLIIVAFFCLLGALIPQYVPGTGIRNDVMDIPAQDVEKRLNQQDVRNQQVDDRFQAITNELAESRKWQDSMSDRLNIFLVGFLIFVGKQMFERAFGGRFGDKNNGNGNGTKTG